MVYRRKSFGRRRRSRRAPWYKRKYNAMQLASKAAKGVWYLKGLVNSEMLHNQSIGGTSISSTGTVILLNGIAQNDTASGRTGNSVLMRNIFLRLNFTQHASATFTTIRVMVVLDKQQIGDTSPAITDILESASPYASLATANTGRFKILKHYFFTLDNSKSLSRAIEYFRDIRLHTRYNGVNNTDIQKNGLYLVAISDQATNTPNMGYMWKVGYHDN